MTEMKQVKSHRDKVTQEKEEEENLDIAEMTTIELVRLIDILHIDS